LHPSEIQSEHNCSSPNRGSLTNQITYFNRFFIREKYAIENKHHVMNRKDFTIGVILYTYNDYEWLEKTLWGYLCQDYHADEIIIADDGSDDLTDDVIERFRKRFRQPIKHIKQEGKGDSQSSILNKAINEAKSKYLIFSESDCIPRFDFISSHIMAAKEGHFLAGGCVPLSHKMSRWLIAEDITHRNAFLLPFMRENGMKKSFRNLKLSQNKTFASIMNVITSTGVSFNKQNSSCWRKDIIKANGFNEKMKCFGYDHELGERLSLLGIKPTQVSYTAVCIHLYHEEPNVSKEITEQNKRIIEEVLKEKSGQTGYGLNSLSMSTE